MKVSTEKCKKLHLVRKKTRYQYMSGAIQLGSSSAEKDFGVLGDTRLNMNQQYTLASKAKGIFGCIR